VEDDDKPSKTYLDRKEWWHDGVLHRSGKPAVVFENGAEKWYHRGFLITINICKEAVARLMSDRYHNMMPRIGPLHAVYAINGRLLPCVQRAIETNQGCTLPLAQDIMDGKHLELHDSLMEAANNCVSNAFKQILDERTSPLQKHVILTVAHSGEMLSWTILNDGSDSFKIFSATHDPSLPRMRVTLERLSTECTYTSIYPLTV
jgi:hypothetical protein